VRLVAPEVVIWHVPNGQYRTRAEGAKLRWVGVLSGVFDLTLALPDGRTAFWETKAEKGRLSDEQQAFAARLDALGHRWAVVRSVDDARRELQALGIEISEALR
jgi:hypothetical protein